MLHLDQDPTASLKREQPVFLRAGREAELLHQRRKEGFARGACWVVVLPPPLQGSLPAGWLAFTGRESNPQDRYKRFQIAVSSSFSGFILAQGKFHSRPSP
jgi:hypothetical protein